MVLLWPLSNFELGSSGLMVPSTEIGIMLSLLSFAKLLITPPIKLSMGILPR